MNEEFAGEDQGLWQYQLIVKTETWQVEDKQAADLPKFVQGLYRRKYQQKINRRTRWHSTTVQKLNVKMAVQSPSVQSIVRSSVSSGQHPLVQ
ncbi:Gp37 protein [Actinobacillus equuli]|nr:Gp37 protein [Actinobacillus equuli]